MGHYSKYMRVIAAIPCRDIGAPIVCRVHLMSIVYMAYNRRPRWRRVHISTVGMGSSIKAGTAVLALAIRICQLAKLTRAAGEHSGKGAYADALLLLAMLLPP